MRYVLHRRTGRPRSEEGTYIMSATGRSDVRDPEDFYSTPAWAVRAVLPYITACGDLSEADILEPSAGRGAIVKELIAAGANPKRIVAVEPNDRRAAELLDLGVLVYTEPFEDFAAAWIDNDRPLFDVVASNPPFSLAEQHIALMHDLLDPAGVCAVLVRLAFLAEGQDRAGFRKAFPHDRLELVKRPSFTAEALAYLTDADLLGMATEDERASAFAAFTRDTRVPARTAAERAVALVRSRMRRTDSCAYAWGLFGQGRGGRFWTHEEEPELLSVA